jgi:DNA-binding MurR/RpiR family transcriptional regulator
MSAPHALEDLIALIQAQFPRLSPQFQAAARYLIDHPVQVPTLSARKLAVLAGVQPATLVRLAQHLGYAGWEAMKAVFTRDFHLRPGGYAARAQSLVQRPSADQDIWQTAAQQHARNLLALEAANQQAMPAAVEVLARSTRILVAGFRSCYPAAFSLRYLCSLFRPEVHLLHNTGGTLSLDLHHLHADDTLILIGYAPYSREIVELATAAQAQGPRIVALSDSRVAPIALQADCVLTFPTQGNSFFPSTVALHALVELLAQQFLVRSGAHAIAELARTEARLHSTGAYL